MWLIPDKSTRNITNINAETRRNLKIALNLDILTFAQYESSEDEIYSIFFGFETNGLFYSHPALNSSEILKNGYNDTIDGCQLSDNKGINATCFSWYIRCKLMFNTYKEMNYFDKLQITSKRVTFFPSAIWNATLNKMIVIFCQMFANEATELIGVQCIEMRTNSKLIYII